MSEDARAIVAAILATAAAQTGRPWQELRAEFEAIREELKPRLTPEQEQNHEAWLADISKGEPGRAE